MKDVDTTGMIFEFSRPLAVFEIREIEQWIIDQNFKGRVVRESSHEIISGKLYVGLHFKDPDDLMLFKLTWCG